MQQQFGLFGWGASGPYKKVYEKFGITGTSKSGVFAYWDLLISLSTDIAAVGKKVVDFYQKKGGPVISPLLKAF